MNKINPQDSESKSQDLVSENIEQLKQLFPEIVSDGKVDFEVLKEVLGEEVIEDEEYYKFTWAGKAQARREANKPSTGTLRPAKDESVDWDKTSNLYVEGDNLEVLKLMQKSYAGKVKMIYIDPPYNTGKDFVYKDNYKDNLKNYQELTGQVDSEGNKMTTNTESQGRFHSNWLNMMYPRLRLARNLLSDDGIIFMSIDEHEVENLKKIGNEIFGEENFLGNISNISNPKGRSDDKFIATSHEYIIVYSKFLSNVNFYGFAPDEKILRRYNKLDNDKKYREIDLRKTGDNDLREDRPNLFYYFLYNEKTNDFYATRDSEIPKDYRQIKPLRKDGEEGNWRWGIENSNSNINKLEPKFMPSRKVWSVFEKDYLKDRGLVKPTSSWNFKDVNSERGSETFINLNFDKRIFPKPKPIGTIIRVLKVGTDENDLILDFFSGSASTAHAVMSLNSIDGKNRKHIQVQLPEPTDEKSEAYKAGYKTLTEIGKERIRRAGKQIIEDLEQQIQAQEEKLQKLKEEDKQDKVEAIETEITSLKERKDNLDIGFKVFKLDSSNIKAWSGSTEDLKENLLSQVENIKGNRTNEDVLYEILIKFGIDLTAPILTNTVEDKTIYTIGYGALFVCLDDDITVNIAKSIGEWKNELEPKASKVVFKDSGLDDVTKTNAIQILKQYEILEVRSI